ncbi:MAG: hypothetical protein ABI237_02355 [Ginsengibacter sp.]
MTNAKSQPDDFYTPSNFYNLQAAGFSVWIICLVIASIFTDLTSLYFRIIAISFSLLISLSLFLKHKTWRRTYNYILIIVNAGLIFINASGYNSISHSYAFDNSALNHKESTVQQNSFLSLSNQVLWWPDYQLLAKNDSLDLETKKLTRINEGLINQFGFLKDWINTTITDKKSRDTLNSVLKYIGTYRIDSSDFVYLKTSSEKYITKTNKTIDSLGLELKLRPVIRTGYIVNGKEISAPDYVDTLLKKNLELEIRLQVERQQRKIDSANKPPNASAGNNQVIQLPNK